MTDRWKAAARALLALSSLATAPARAEDETVPRVDRRAVEVRTLDTPYTFAAPADPEAWRARARFLREQVLVSAGLWPMPEKGPLHAHVFGRVERGDYSVEKVYFESHPGFYVTGNLYRPVGKTGPFPGVLSPHGHWAYGRLENGADGSIPARCITLARQGYVVFSWDMVGYNDSRQVDHRLLDPHLAQWGIGSLGLHLWNSIRSVDFLESLPDVDPSRLACTGASGGGTQTFLLTAVDDRIEVAAPVNMISHYMQGGDVCENAPNLRLDTNNMEIAALTAPRPMLMVSAAGDWTRDTPRIEFPAVESVYALLGAKDRVSTVQFIADHNYNRDSREAVYGWFARWLLGRPDASPVPERGVHRRAAGGPARLSRAGLPGRRQDAGADRRGARRRPPGAARGASPARRRGSRALPRGPRARPAPRAGRGVARARRSGRARRRPASWRACASWPSAGAAGGTGCRSGSGSRRRKAGRPSSSSTPPGSRASPGARARSSSRCGGGGGSSPRSTRSTPAPPGPSATRATASSRPTTARTTRTASRTSSPPSPG